ncbi:hypothetical protein E2C01_047721 [Portunus trituberculatus]|uniref:Uncharacterized protein n=1 Tax=Portunus trituberculatus TaxID=210409 RepID=A0A5B7G1U7_PORTR|nr:hypothetical protein [Portunus trituberculatus]
MEEHQRRLPVFPDVYSSPNISRHKPSPRPATPYHQPPASSSPLSPLPPTAPTRLTRDPACSTYFFPFLVQWSIPAISVVVTALSPI